MPRIPRYLIKEKDRCYHIFSQTTGQQFCLGDLEKEYLMRRMKKLSSVYFVRVLTFAILDNHFHLLIQMQGGDEYSDQEIRRRFQIYYGAKEEFQKERIHYYRERWSDLSMFVKELKQGFSSWYNRLNNRRGYFWAERFQSVVVENGTALLSCAAYIDLNAVRANLVDRPEDYRFCGLGYHIQSGNKNGFLSLDLLEIPSDKKHPLHSYRRHVYEVGSLERLDGKRPIPRRIADEQAQAGYIIKKSDMFRYRSRYFTESVVLGSRDFVKQVYGRLQPYLKTGSDREPVRIRGIDNLYSLRRFRSVVR